MIKETTDTHQLKMKRQLAADRLRQARIDAGFPTANHASVSFGWRIKTYLQHEDGIKSFDVETALKYSKAFKVSSIWLLGDKKDG